MKIPLSWLKQWIPLPFSPKEIAAILTKLGIEVESILTEEPVFEDVVVAEVLSVKLHPAAEKLVIAKVTDGKEEKEVVCGAPNCRKGLRTAFAKVGASILDHGGKKITVKKLSLRGVDSYGMLCSSSELQLSEDHEGLIEFSRDIPLGKDVRSLFSDVILEVAFTPNFSHAMSILGVARELSAATGFRLTPPLFPKVKEGSIKIEDLISVEIQEKTLCPRYACRFIKDVKIGPSPSWLVQILSSLGLKTINNVVDVTNFVMLELGHPLHAFDYQKIKDKKIIIKRAHEAETILTLDGENHTLKEDILLIADPEKPLALAGIMGGKNSEISYHTKDVLLESAFFDQTNIRLSSRYLGIQTDSSKRFERGVDLNTILKALDRAAELIQQVAGGEIAKGFIDQKEKEFKEKKIIFRFTKVNELLGTAFSKQEVEEMLHRFGFLTEDSDKKEKIIVTVPSYRNDVELEIDLIEEIARLYGYDNIPRKKIKYSASETESSSEFLIQRNIRLSCVSLGLQEWITCDLIGPFLLEHTQDPTFQKESFLSVVNPTSVDQSILRSSLFPGMLEVVKNNMDHQNFTLHAFEIGRIHIKKQDRIEEPLVLGIILCGAKNPQHFSEKQEEVDFFDLRGKLELLFSTLGIKNTQFVNTELLHQFHTGRQAQIFAESKEIGYMGEVHPSILRKMDIPRKVYYAEISLVSLIEGKQQPKKLKPLPIYPSSERDWTVTLHKKIPIAKIFACFEKAPSQLLEKIFLLDLYESDQLGKDKHNATFRFVYRDLQKTIAQEEVEKEHQKILKEAVEEIEKQEENLNLRG